MLKGSVPSASQIGAWPAESMQGITGLRYAQVSVTPGLMTGQGLSVVAALTGARLGQPVFASSSSALPLGVAIGNVRVPANDQVEIRLVTSLLSVTVGQTTIDLLLVTA